MHQEAANELRVIKGDFTLCITWFLSSGRKGGTVFGDGQNTTVGNSNLMCISSKIFDCIAKPVESLLNVGTPIFFIKVIFPVLPVVRVLQFSTGRRKRKSAILIVGIQVSQIFSLEFITENLYGDKKFRLGFTYLLIDGEPATRNDTMHVHMIVQLLIPGMKDLNDSGCCSEILLVFG